MPRMLYASAAVVALTAVALLPAGGSAAGNSCSATQFRQIARQEFQPWWKPVENRWRLRRCLASAPNVKTFKAMKRIRENFERGKARAVAGYRRLTPYVGLGGRFSIPTSIVACESGGSWAAVNASGAAGPYQIMPEWGRPWPVRGVPDRMAHHRIAAMIWAGGAGAGNWVCA